MSKVKTILVLLFLILLDQVTKLWVLGTLAKNGPIPIIHGVLELLYVENRGAAFGIFQNRQIVFSLIAVVAIVAISLVLLRLPKEKHFMPLRICLVFVVAGAAGNLIDRVVRDFVVDFIYFKLIDFPVFNVADIYVTVSAFCLMLLVLFYYKDEDLERISGKRG